MDTKGWIIVIACVAGMVLLYPQMVRKPVADAPATNPAVEPASTPASAPGKEAVPPVETAMTPDEPAGEHASVNPSLAEERLTLKTDLARFEFTNIGAGVAKIELMEHALTLDSEERVILNRYSQTPVGAFLAGMPDGSLNAFRIVEKSATAVTFEGKTAEGLLVRKRYSLSEGEKADGYLLDLAVTLKNESETPYQRGDLSLFMGSVAPLHPGEWVNQTGFSWRDFKKMRFKDVNVFSASNVLGFSIREARQYFNEAVEGLRFTAVMNQFFTIVLSENSPVDGSLWATRRQVQLKGYEDRVKGRPQYEIDGGFGLGEVRLGPNDQVTREFQIYAGPKEYQRLKELGEHRSELMNYRGMPLFGRFSAPVSVVLVRMLTWIEARIGVAGSYGIAVILMTLLIRICIWPLHAKSTRTMKRMSLLAPLMTELKEKHADDPQKLNQEMMGLYKDYGVNPFGGCLPIIFQLPIFLGFYRMLQSAVELRHQSFLWVEDLSMPDTLFMIPVMGGVPFNLLPLLMGGTMVLQMKVTPKTGDKMQQRIFMLMPLIFLVFCYNFAAALALYWTTQNIFSIGQTWLMNRIPEPELKKRGPRQTPSFLEEAKKKKSRTQVSGQGPKQTKSRKQKRK